MFDQHLDNNRRCGRLVHSAIEGGIDYKDHSPDIPNQQSAYHAHLVLWLLLEHYVRTISPPHRRPCHAMCRKWAKHTAANLATCAVIDAVAVRADVMPS
eukprot:scaffold17203_cov96-Skeletonema_dohrnii-CCMP3373.AAC.1